LDNTTSAVVKPHPVKAGLAGKIIKESIAGGFKIMGALMTTLEISAAEESLEVYRHQCSDVVHNAVHCTDLDEDAALET
jgi:nucleoside diphosphate kinase